MKDIFFHGDGSKTDGTPGAHQFWVSLRVHPPYNNVDVVAGPIGSQRPQLTPNTQEDDQFPNKKKPQCARRTWPAQKAAPKEENNKTNVLFIPFRPDYSNHYFHSGRTSFLKIRTFCLSLLGSFSSPFVSTARLGTRSVVERGGRKKKEIGRTMIAHERAAPSHTQR